MLIYYPDGVYVPEATTAEVAELHALYYELRAAEERYFERFSEEPDNGSAFALEGATSKSEQAKHIASLKTAVSSRMAKLVRGCTRGPIPSDLSYAEDENGTLILVCSHEPDQHRYSLGGKRLN